MKSIKLLCRKSGAYWQNRVLFKNVISRCYSTDISTFSDGILTLEKKKDIEKCWRNKINSYTYDETDNTKEKFYVLSMFPYPSGKLHMGHVRVYTISDAVAHFYRMNGYNVLHPMGWDAFGLPAENSAIEKQIDPAEWTYDNIAKMRDQLKLLNYTFDWDREFATCDPDYYKWTQELFLKLYEKDLIYQKEAFVNWDPVDQTVLAEEQVDANNCSWRSGAKVEKKLLNQWFIRTIPFAKSLFEGLKDPTLKEWNDIIKIQTNWIGQCSGISFEFQLVSNIPNYPKKINVWTNTPESIEFAKFVAISPDSLLHRSEYCESINEQIKIIDAKVLNPFNGEELPIFVTNTLIFQPFRDTYIGIPSASVEDYNFSETVGIKFQQHSIKNDEEQQQKLSEILSKAREWKIGGYSVSPRLQDWLISRQRYWGTPIPIIHCPNCGAQPVSRDQLPVVLPKITFSFSNKKPTLLDAKDWLNTSCPKCGGHATRESDTMDTFVDSSWYFLRYIDPRNTEEMFAIDKVKKMFPVDLYVGGKEHGVLHLYYARFISHFLHSQGLLPSKEPFKQLLVQGMVMGKTYREKNKGMYLKPDEVEKINAGKYVKKGTKEVIEVFWEKMSKSKHNGIDPTHLLDNYGIDTTRLLILADVAPTSNRNWTESTIPGIIHWQNRLWNVVNKFANYRNTASFKVIHESPISVESIKEDLYMFDSRNYFLKSVTFNMTKSQQLSVAISRMQGLTNSLRKVSLICLRTSPHFERALAVQIIMLAPVAPHFASELWATFCSVKQHLIDHSEVQLDKDVLEQTWPKIDEKYHMNLNLTINETFRRRIKVPKYKLDRLTVEAANNLIRSDPDVELYLKSKKIVETKFHSEEGYDTDMNIITEKQPQMDMEIKSFHSVK